MNKGRFSFHVGNFECIVVSDGTFAYFNPSQFFFANAPKERLEHALREHNIDPDRWEQHVTPYLCLVIITGQHRVLVDTGAGNLAPTTGKLIPNLQAEGIAPKDIDTVIRTTLVGISVLRASQLSLMLDTSCGKASGIFGPRNPI